MAPPSAQQYLEALRSSPRALAQTPPATLEKAAEWLHQVARWNERANLTTLIEPQEAAERQFWEAAAALPYLVDGRMLDIGSGAGFPGLPLKLLRPDLEITLLEPRRKRAVFLREVIQALALEGIEVLENRLEELGEPAYASFAWRAIDLEIASLEPLAAAAGPVRAFYWASVEGGRKLEASSPQSWDTLHWVRLRPSRDRVLVVLERIPRAE